MRKEKFAILGIHGKDVRTVAGDVARVRFFPDGKPPIDEDIPLPAVNTLEEMVAIAARKRLAELEAAP